jgi:hypothetical protein
MTPKDQARLAAWEAEREAMDQERARLYGMPTAFDRMLEGLLEGVGTLIQAVSRQDDTPTQNGRTNGG